MGCSPRSSRGKFIAIKAYLRKQEKSQINRLTLHLKQLMREEQIRPKVSRRKEIIKIRTEINEKEMKKTTEEINESKSRFFEKNNETGSSHHGAAEMNPTRNHEASLSAQWVKDSA